MGDRLFKRQERLHSKKEFLTVYQQGTRTYTRYFTLIEHKNHSGCRRLGITVSKKVGNAVRRNRIKRLVREFFRLNKMRLPESNDTVLIGKKGMPRLSYQDVCNELESLVSKKASE
ncbi:MAG: ribonuclease P protein component [Syntrophales bacterium LBB04]|nr:ribonuclease P protein component [Syntrophales bacterium LBB04]